MKKRRISAAFFICILLAGSRFISIQAEQEENPPAPVEDNQGIQDKLLTLTIEEAVKTGLEKSTALEQVENEVSLSDLKNDRSEYLSNKLREGDKRIDDAEDQLSKAQAAFNSGVLPQPVGDIPAGTSLDAVPESVREGVAASLSAKEQLLDGAHDGILTSLQDAGTTMSENLGFDSLGNLTIEGTRDLMTTSSNISYEVTKASKEIYRNQVALLIQNDYYEALKAKKIMEVKQKAVERGKQQYDFAQESYEEGMKAKDDMLIAKIYYQGTQIELEKAAGEYENALIQLKKDMNIPLDQEIHLIDAEEDTGAETLPLQEGLNSGLKNRLEIRKGLGEVIVYNTTFTVTEQRYPSNTFQHKEAELLKEKAQIGYKTAVQEVKASIRQSYQTLVSTRKMLDMAGNMVEDAQESVQIAEYKYKEGFGVDTSLLQSLDLEDSAGTIVEVLAAEENLAEVEEKVVEITYGYNLAKMKYNNDIGNWIY